MSKSFVYFGEDCFKKLDFLSSSSPLKFNSQLKGHIFSSLIIDGQICEIDKFIDCWSFALYCVGNKIYYCGFNGKDIDEKPILLISESSSLPSNHQIELVSAGWNKALFINSNKGQCYLVSNATDLKLQLYDISNIATNIKQLIPADSCNFFLTEDGFVYGSNNTFILPVLWKMSCKVSDVACGKEHTLLLTTSGQVYSFGSSSRGQLGHGNIECIKEPELIEALDGIAIKSIAAGGWHSAAVSVDDDLYMWGWNESGQVGYSCEKMIDQDGVSSVTKEICFLPKLVDFDKDSPIRQISCGSRHSAVLFGDHSVFTWGWNKYGQLGRKVENCHVPGCVVIASCYVAQEIQCFLWSTLIVVQKKD